MERFEIASSRAHPRGRWWEAIIHANYRPRWDRSLVFINATTNWFEIRLGRRRTGGKPVGGDLAGRYGFGFGIGVDRSSETRLRKAFTDEQLSTDFRFIPVTRITDIGLSLVGLVFLLVFICPNWIFCLEKLIVFDCLSLGCLLITVSFYVALRIIRFTKPNDSD